MGKFQDVINHGIDTVILCELVTLWERRNLFLFCNRARNWLRARVWFPYFQFSILLYHQVQILAWMSVFEFDICEVDNDKYQCVTGEIFVGIVLRALLSRMAIVRYAWMSVCRLYQFLALYLGSIPNFGISGIIPRLHMILVYWFRFW